MKFEVFALKAFDTKENRPYYSNIGDLNWGGLLWLLDQPSVVIHLVDNNITERRRELRLDKNTDYSVLHIGGILSGLTESMSRKEVIETIKNYPCKVVIQNEVIVQVDTGGEV